MVMPGRFTKVRPDQAISVSRRHGRPPVGCREFEGTRLILNRKQLLSAAAIAWQTHSSFASFCWLYLLTRW